MGRGERTRKSSGEGRAPLPGDLLPGSFAGEYEIEGVIAQGGSGAVYRARHRTTSQGAAIKVLHASRAQAPEIVARFGREVEVVKRLRHPCIVAIDDVGELPDGRPFYAMEHLEGMTLDSLLHVEGRLSPWDAFEVLAPVCQALSAAHQVGVVHGRLEASDVFVSFEGEQRRIKLLGFGTAHLGDDSAPSATIDGRADVYALGVLLFKLLTGKSPFRGHACGDLARQHREEPPPRPSLQTPMPPGLDEVVLRCLEKRPELRFSTVEELRSALWEVVSTDPEAASQRASDLTVPAITVQMHLGVRTTPDELDDDLAEDLGRVLDRAEALLQGADFVVALTAGMTLLAVRNIDEEADAGQSRADAVELAWSLYDELARRPLADARVDITLGVHADEAVVRPASVPEIVGGSIANTWTLPGESRGIWATPEILEGVSGFETKPASAGWVSILGRSTRATSRPPI